MKKYQLGFVDTSSGKRRGIRKGEIVAVALVLSAAVLEFVLLWFIQQTGNLGFDRMAVTVLRISGLFLFVCLVLILFSHLKTRA